MASIIIRNSKYSVVYYYKNQKDEKKQKWETYDTLKTAQSRLKEVEYKQMKNIDVTADNLTVNEYLKDFVSLYGEENWSISTYEDNTGLIRNYINPIIGNMRIKDINPLKADKYIKQLKETKTRDKKSKGKTVGAEAIKKIVKLLRCAFGQAVKWELIEKNPFEFIKKVKTKYQKRDIWTEEMIIKAFNECTDLKLYVAMNLAFACSLRAGEILGLTWDNVHISDEDIEKDNTYIFIDKELRRVSYNTIETLKGKDIIKIFPPCMENTSTCLVLKAPKTESSVRKVWLPKDVVSILKSWKESQENMIRFTGNDYQENNLVITMPDGRPCEERNITNAFSKLREKAGLPKVVFHSLRHSSTTYKLKITGGDLKETQGDTGHAQMRMVTDVYSHIVDEDRKKTAQKFQANFYNNLDLKREEAEEISKNVDLSLLLKQLEKSPEIIINKLSELLK